jgi:hypothetical protein
MKALFSPVSQRGVWLHYYRSIERASYLFVSKDDGNLIEAFGREQTSQNYPDNAF